MYIVQIASELAPIAKAGGLGDVLYGLSKEISRLNHDVEIILPKYDLIDLSLISDLHIETQEFFSYEGPYRHANTIWSGSVDNLKILLLEPHHPAKFFNRGKIYGCPDDIDRFIYFSRAAMEYIYKSGRKPSIIHVHDWPTSLCAVLQKEMYIPLGIHPAKTVLTLHNLAHQGKCLSHHLSLSGLRGDDYLSPSRLQDPHTPNLINLLKGGIVYSDFLTTVSPSYEKEIQTPEGGHGLQEILHHFSFKLKGILNGIDPEFWNPATDPSLLANYDLSSYKKGKELNQMGLRKKLKLAEANPGSLASPLVCTVSRIAHQKSPSLIHYAIEKTLALGGQFILCGTCETPELEAHFQALKKKYSRNKHVFFHLKYDEALAHLCFAAADITVIPSLFEPCGLTQLIALRYGTVPIVRETGGLKDTVKDEENGFTFLYPDFQGVDWGLSRAFSLFQTQPQKWQALIERGMRADFSWRHSAQDYIQIYTNLSPEPIIPELAIVDPKPS